MKKPLVIELFSGMFGWSQGWLELGGRAIGFDLEHLPHHGPVPEFNDDKRRAAKCGGDWFGSGDDCSLMRRMSSRSTARKAASAMIARIPLELSRWVERAYWPDRFRVSLTKSDNEI